MKDEEIKLRILNNSEDDYKLLEKWYQREEVYTHFEQRKLNYEEVKKKYYPRTKLDSKIPVFMIEYNDTPVGIIQYQAIDDENKKLYALNIDNSFEIDIFIGEPNLYNKGIGRKSINLLSNYLFKEKKANAIVMCPLKENKNAIKCYENCGFKIKNKFQTPNTIGFIQEFVLMIKEK